MIWHEEKNHLQANFKFKDFAEAFGFMTEVALYVQQHDHHPNWSNMYNTVEIQLATHSAGNIVTEKDRKLAEVIEAVYKKYKP